ADSSDVTTRWSQLLAAQLGVDLVSVARYSSDARQVYRMGAAPLDLTIAGGKLPATGAAPAAITHLNGLAPSADASVNPASFLNAGDAGVTSGMSATGWIGDRPVIVTLSNGAATDYKIAQTRPGAGEVTLSGPVRFIPDASMQFDGRLVLVQLGNNYF